MSIKLRNADSTVLAITRKTQVNMEIGGKDYRKGVAAIWPRSTRAAQLYRKGVTLFGTKCTVKELNNPLSLPPSSYPETACRLLQRILNRDFIVLRTAEEYQKFIGKINENLFGSTDW